MNKCISSKFVLRGKLFLFTIILCFMATSVAVYSKNEKNTTSNNLELIYNENEIEYVEELSDAEYYIGAKQIFSDSTQDILAPTSVVWSTSDDRIAQIKDNGAIIPKSAGTVIITGKYNGMKSSSTIKIKKGKIVDLSVPEKHLSLNRSLHKKGLQNSYDLVLLAKTTAGNLYDLSKDKDVVWKSANENTAAIKNGQISSEKPAKIKVSASFKGLTTEMDIDFVDKKIVNIHIDKTAVAIEDINGSEDVKMIAEFEDGSTMDISKFATWKSQDTGVAIAYDGRIDAKAEGSTKIIAQYEEYNFSIEASVKKTQKINSKCSVFP